MQRIALLIAINLILLGLVLYFGPQQVPVTIYKLSLVTLAALVGFWVDRMLFPYARPDQIMCKSYSVGGPALGNKEVLFAACMLRRSFIIGMAMLAMGLGWWQREALMTTARRLATREEIDAMCGKDKRAQLHCRENLNYPRRILNVFQPRYFGWGAKIVMGGSV